MKDKLNSPKKIKSFTMIEILVVVTVIGVLFASAVVSYRSLTVSSRDAKRKADLEQIRAALEMYRSSEPSVNGSYPDFDDNCNNLHNIFNFGAYLPQIPTDPKFSNGVNYYCTSSSSPSDFILYSTLESVESGDCGGSCSLGPDIVCEYGVGPYGKVCGP